MEEACANLLGTPAEFAQQLGVDPERLDGPGDSWEQQVGRYWNESDASKKTASFTCDVHYKILEYTEGYANGDPTTYTALRGSW